MVKIFIGSANLAGLVMFVRGLFTDTNDMIAGGVLTMFITIVFTIINEDL